MHFKSLHFSFHFISFQMHNLGSGLRTAHLQHEQVVKLKKKQQMMTFSTASKPTLHTSSSLIPSWPDWYSVPSP